MSTSDSASARHAIAHDITENILAALARGVMPWRRPWDGARNGLALPRRASGAVYRGVNVILLWNAACDSAYASPYWLTFRQAAALGAHVRKGERGVRIVYYGASGRTRETRASGGEEPEIADRPGFRFLKAYTVFNADQIDALPDTYRPAAPRPAPIAIDGHEAWFSALAIARIPSRDTACYIPARDVIAMPPLAAFETAAAYAATLNHEACHATGAAHRLDRDFSQRFGAEARAMEELVAEIGAAMLGAHHHLPPAHIEDHAAYISSWMKVLRHDPRAFVSAAAKAQAAVDWLLDASPLPPAIPADNGDET